MDHEGEGKTGDLDFGLDGGFVLLVHKEFLKFTHDNFLL
jgi:hypothetical protein